jgi:hypothetical protein
MNLGQTRGQRNGQEGTIYGRFSTGWATQLAHTTADATWSRSWQPVSWQPQSVRTFLKDEVVVPLKSNWIDRHANGLPDPVEEGAHAGLGEPGASVIVDPVIQNGIRCPKANGAVDQGAATHSSAPGHWNHAVSDRRASPTPVI